MVHGMAAYTGKSVALISLAFVAIKVDGRGFDGPLIRSKTII